MIRTAFISLGMALLAVTAQAKPNEQLLRSIEHRLAFWNVGAVDYDKLTTAQAAALHLKLTNAPPRFGSRAFLFRQELITILEREDD